MYNAYIHDNLHIDQPADQMIGPKGEARLKENSLCAETSAVIDPEGLVSINMGDNAATIGRV